MLLYALTIFLGAFLLFEIQPIIARYVLPWFGGGAGVWTACMMYQSGTKPDRGAADAGDGRDR